MVSAVHHRCIRLIRVAIEAIYLGDLPAGQVRELEEVDFFNLLDL
jgi:23S rRNA pseudouridine2457 synthase